MLERLVLSINDLIKGVILNFKLIKQHFQHWWSPFFKVTQRLQEIREFFVLFFIKSHFE
jgi:hypothetical protein